SGGGLGFFPGTKMIWGRTGVDIGGRAAGLASRYSSASTGYRWGTMGSERYAVLILGHGEMGRVMEFLLSGRHQLVIWEKDLVRGTENLLLEEAAPAADFICLMLPAAAHPDVAARLKGNVAAGATLVTVAKGLDGEGRPPAVSLREVL